MSTIKIFGQQSLPHMPWENKPAGYNKILWRYSANPIIGWNPIPDGSRAFNSAVVPYGDAYVGDFRTKGFLPHTLVNYLALLGWSPEEVNGVWPVKGLPSDLRQNPPPAPQESWYGLPKTTQYHLL